MWILLPRAVLSCLTIGRDSVQGIESAVGPLENLGFRVWESRVGLSIWGLGFRRYLRVRV